MLRAKRQGPPSRSGRYIGAFGASHEVYQTAPPIAVLLLVSTLYQHVWKQIEVGLRRADSPARLLTMELGSLGAAGREHRGQEGRQSG